MTTQGPLRDQLQRIVAGVRGRLTPQEWARLFAAGRAGLVARMIDEGLEPERADQLVDAWDDEAGRRGLSCQATDYWDQAPAWIQEQARLMEAAGERRRSPS